MEKTISIKKSVFFYEKSRFEGVIYRLNKQSWSQNMSMVLIGKEIKKYIEIRFILRVIMIFLWYKRNFSDKKCILKREFNH